MNIVEWYVISSPSYGWQEETDKWVRGKKERFVTDDCSRAEFEMMFGPADLVLELISTDKIVFQ